jgi:hypothetical protein
MRENVKLLSKGFLAKKQANRENQAVLLSIVEKLSLKRLQPTLSLRQIAKILKKANCK